MAADAVLEEKGSATIPYSNSPENLRETDTPHYGYTEGYTVNLFSPPIETEGMDIRFLSFKLTNTEI